MGRDELMTVEAVLRLRPGESFKGVYAVRDLQANRDRGGGTYWSVTVMDPTGAMEGKAWSSARWLDRREGEPLSEDQIQSLKGMSVGVVGQVKDYRGSLQVDFRELYRLDQDKYPPLDLVPRSPFPQEELEERFWRIVGSCGEELRGFLEGIFVGDLRDRFFSYPAAVSNHHAYRAGLLEHTVHVAEAALGMCGPYGDVSLEVVAAGALLHDLGKVRAYRMSPLPEVTVEGSVLDHVAMGYALFEELVRDRGLRGELAVHLGHIILSHHGQKEYGSPVVPQTLEALIVSAADELDFHLFCCREGLRWLRDGQAVSDFNRSTQRRFWTGELPQRP